MSREYVLLQVERPDIVARLAAIEPVLVETAIRRGVIKSPEEARIRPVNARDLGKATLNFVHEFTSANAEETYVSAVEIKDKVIVFYGIALTSDSPKLLNLRFGVGVPVRPVFETGLLDPLLVQQEPKGLFSQDVMVTPGEKLTIYVEGRAAGREDFCLLGLVCEKG